MRGETEKKGGIYNRKGERCTRGDKKAIEGKTFSLLLLVNGCLDHHRLIKQAVDLARACPGIQSSSKRN